MGMSASQARLLTLQARQSNLEYQGQQINQERTILSQQVSALNESLLAINVPTPPSTSEFTTVQYAGTLGATTYEFDATTVKPGKEKGTSIVTVLQDAFGDSLQKNSAVAAVKEQTPTVKVVHVEDVSNIDDISNLYVIDGDGVRKASDSDFEYDEETETYKPKRSNDIYKESDAINAETKTVTNATSYTVNGKPTYEISGEAGLEDAQISAYEDAIKNSGLRKPDGSAYEPKDFYIYFDNEGNANFVLKADVTDGNNNAITYAHVVNGSYKKNITYEGCQLTFDASNGRITELMIPEYKDGEVISRTAIDLTAQTVTDEFAYQDAYAKYEYDQYEYDKLQQEINAKTEIIQQEDRNLELKLQRLDNERTQITTEIEAVDKVINDNIEASYKTFSG